MKALGLPRPDKELAERILRPVGFQDRLIGHCIHRRTGAQTTTMYCFREVLALLNEPLPVLDFAKLEKWLREVMSDPELADRIGSAAGKGGKAQENTRRVAALMEERLEQCQALARIIHEFP